MPVALWVMITAIPNRFFSPPTDIDLNNLTFLIGCRFNVMGHHIDPVGNLVIGVRWLLNGLGSDQGRTLRQLLDTWDVDMDQTMITIPRACYEEAVRDKIDWVREKT